MIALQLVATSPALVRANEGAARSGFDLEAQIEAGLRERGFEIIAARDWDQTEPAQGDGTRKAILGAPYASIYNHAARIEFLLLFSGRRILVEVKRQRVAGSTDEKLPYVFANAQLNIGFGQEFIFVMDGNGWKKGALQWIERRASETESFSVMRPREFFNFLSRL